MYRIWIKMPGTMGVMHGGFHHTEDDALDFGEAWLQDFPNDIVMLVPDEEN